MWYKYDHQEFNHWNSISSVFAVPSRFVSVLSVYWPLIFPSNTTRSIWIVTFPKLPWNTNHPAINPQTCASDNNYSCLKLLVLYSTYTNWDVCFEKLFLQLIYILFHTVANCTTIHLFCWKYKLNFIRNTRGALGGRGKIETLIHLFVMPNQFCRIIKLKSIKNKHIHGFPNVKMHRFLVVFIMS